MRSSPIFCGFDALAIIIRIIVYLVNRITPFRAIQSTVAARFDDIDDELEGLQMLEKLTFVRWVLFVLTLTQSIKLFALGGVPWSKGWGCLFLVSFVVVELVVFLRQSFERIEISERSCLPQWIAFASARHEAYMTDRVQLLKKYLEMMDALCFTIASISHILLLAWVIWQIFSFPLRDYSTTGAVFMPVMASIWIFSLEVYGCIIAPDAIIADTWKWKESFAGILTVAIIVASFIGHIKLLFIIYDSEVALEYAISICFDGFVTAIFLLVLLMACILLCCSKTMQKQVLFLEGNNSIKDDREEMLMVMALMVFVTSMVASALWYGLRYDSGSTYKPEWTNRLG
jgi:hypothetical protein